MSVPEPTPVDDSSRLREYLSILRVRKWTVIVTTLIAVLGAVFYLQRTQPTYTSTAKVQVKNPLAFLPGTSNQTSAPNMQTEQTLVTSTKVVACAQQYFNYTTGKPIVLPQASPRPSPSPSRPASPSPSRPASPSASASGSVSPSSSASASASPSASRSASPSASRSASPSRSASASPSRSPSPSPRPAPSPAATGIAPASVGPDQFCSPTVLPFVDIVGGARQGLNVSSAAQTTIMSVGFSSHNKANAQAWANSYASAYVETRTLDALGAVNQLRQPLVNREQELLTAKTAQTKNLFAAEEAGDQLKTSFWTDALNRTNQDLANLTSQLQALDPNLVRLNAPQVILDATLPSSPSAPRSKLVIAIGILIGLVLGVGLALIRERLDDSLRGRADLEDLLGAPVLAVVPRVTNWRKRDETHLIAIEQPKASVAEVYRTLRTSVLFAAAQRGLKTLMVTSATAGEGKTTTASNLAVVLSDAGKRVILVSSDLRKPRIHRFFGMTNEKGLSSVLAGEVKPWEAMGDPGRGHLRVLTSGPVPAHPAELLQSEQMGELIEELREVADFVILDTAPVLLVADALAIAPLSDGVLLVVDAENTHRGAVVQAREQLEQVGAPLIGAVLNNFDPAKARATYYGYYGSYWQRYRYGGYYGAGYGEDGRSRRTQAALPPEGRTE